MTNEDHVTEDAGILAMAATVPVNIGGGSNTGADKAADHGDKTFVHQRMIIGNGKRIKIIFGI